MEYPDSTFALEILKAVSAASVLLVVAAQGCVAVALGRRVRAGPRPPISVLKPLKGDEDELYENLRALAGQRYPEFEILCGAEDPADPALGVVRRLAAEMPAVPIRIVCGGAPIGLNPKVNNLAQLLPVARHELVLISDANVRPPPDYLAGLADQIAGPGVGLVHSPLVGVHERSVGALLEHLHLAAFIIRSVCASVVLVDQPAVIGKSMLMRRAQLEQVGGLAAVKDMLAEDYQLGRRFHAAGLRVVLAPQLLPTVAERWSVRRFLARHLRWSQMRRRQCPGWYMLEPLGYPGGLALAVLLVSGGAAWAWTVAVLLAQVGLDAALWRRLRGERLGWAALLLPLRDVLALAMWAVGLVKRGVEWRGHQFVMGPDSALQLPAAWASVQLEKVR